MRIAVVCPYDLSFPGGVQNQAIELVARLNREGDEAWLIGPGRVEQVPVRSIGSSVVIPGNRSRVPLSLNPAVFRRVRSAVAGAEVCHIHEPFAPLVSLGALRSGVPSLATFHADVPDWVAAAYRGGARVGTRMLANVKALTAVSPIAARSVGPGWGTPEIIPNGLDVGSFRLGGERHPHRVVFVGRDEPRKGLDVLISVWPEVVGAVPDAELWIVGVDRDRVLPGVRFLGRVDDSVKKEALSASSVLVAPNLGGESFGIVLAEGMAAGCAVVASDLPAFRWVLGGSGTLVPAGDRRALGGALVEVLENRELRAGLITEGSARVLAFDWSQVVARYRDAYSRVVA